MSAVRHVTPDWLALAATSHPDRLAVSAASQRWTNHELDGATDALATGLAERGVAKGARVAALLADDAPAVALSSALRRLGAVHVPLNRRAARTELAYQLEVCAAHLIVHDGAHAAAAGALAGGSSVETLSGGRSVEALAVETILDAPRVSTAGGRPRADVDLDALATIMFTSGTSGRPRGAMLSHGNHAASADAWAAVLRPRPDDRWLACLPLFHVAGLAIIVRAGRWGVPVEVVARFDAGDVAARIEGGISHLSLVPTQLEPLVTVFEGRTVPRSLRAILLGGGPIPAGSLLRARAAGLPVLTTYGLTETSSGVAVGGADAASLADPSALRPLPGVDVFIADPAGEEGPADEDGIGPILVRGPMVFRGYLDDPETSPEQRADGWLRTGDLGRLDADGLLHVVDRREDLIVSGGENIYPAEVEAVLLEHPAVLDAVVVGRPDPTWGSVAAAAIVLVVGATVSDAALERHCRERLAGYKVPVRWFRRASLPRNEAGKLLRRELCEALLEEPA